MVLSIIANYRLFGTAEGVRQEIRFRMSSNGDLAFSGT